MARVGCSICFETSGESAQPFCCVPCGHLFHIPCITEWLHKSRQCPDCRSSCTVAQIVRIFPSMEVPEPKTSARSNELEETQSRGSGVDDPVAGNAHVKPAVDLSHATVNGRQAGGAANPAANAHRQWNILLPRNMLWEKGLSKHTDNARRTDLSFDLTDGGQVIASAVGQHLSGLNLHPTLITNLNLMGLTTLTAVEAGMQMALNGRDLTAHIEPGWLRRGT